MIIVDVWVPGAAKTKGSMVARPNGSMKESVVGSSAWRALMAQAVRDDIARRTPALVAEVRLRSGIGEHEVMGHGPWQPWRGPVSVTVVAYLAPRTGWFVNGKPEGFGMSWPIWERAGDLDKLVRNVLDALGSKSKNPKMNGGAIVDDNLVCRLVAEKRVAGDPYPAGVRIIVETL